MKANQVVLTLDVREGVRISVVQGDLTLEAVDAIVNAANENLEHGGGVAGAIIQRGGREIQMQSNELVSKRGPVPTGSAAITGAGRLGARFVIHAVGPMWRNRGDEPALLRSAILAALGIANAHHLKSIAIPVISSGIYRFPKTMAVEIHWQAILDYLAEHPETSLRDIRICSIDDLTVEVLCDEGVRRGGKLRL